MMDKFKVIFKDDKSIAGFVPENSYLWKYGSNWIPATFERFVDAEKAINRTNAYRRRKGWKQHKFIIEEELKEKQNEQF